MTQRRLVFVLALLVFLVLCWIPSGLVIGSGFFDDDGFTLQRLRALFIDPITGAYDHRITGLLENSLIVGFGTAIAATLLAVPAAWLLARTKLPLGGLFAFLCMAPLIVPPYVHGIAITQLLWDLEKSDFVKSHGIHIPEIGGFPGAIALLTISLYPMALLLAAKGFRNVDGNAEDAAVLARGRWAAFWRVTLPIALPSILAGFLFVFVFAVSDFGIPDFLSFAYPKIAARQVFATEIYMHFSTERSSEAAAMSSLPLVAIVAIAAFLLLRFEGRAERATSGTLPVPPTERALGGFAIPAVVFMAALVLLTSIVPLAQLMRWAFKEPVLTPEQVAAGAIPGDRFAVVTQAFHEAGPDIGRSFLLSLGAGLLMAAIALPLAHAFERAKTASRRSLLATFAFLPIAFPGVLLAIGQIRFWNRIPGPIYSSTFLVMLTYAARFLPIAFLSVRAGLRSFDPAQEDAARLSGRSYGSTLVRVIGPGIAASLASAVLIGFVLSMRELDSVALLRGGADTLPLRVYSMVHTSRDTIIAALCLVLVVSSAFPLIVWRYVLGKRVRVL